MDSDSDADRMRPTIRPGVAVDVGNTWVKLAEFGETTDKGGGPVLTRVWTIPANLSPEQAIERGLLSKLESGLPWFLSSVNPTSVQHWMAWLQESGLASEARLLETRDFPLGFAVNQPERVGVDRTAAATAAWVQFGTASPGIIVVDAGTAITVDTVLSDGRFLGGAILGGSGLASQALNLMTGQLPFVPFPDDPRDIEAIGKDTEAAIRSGIYWGIIGAVRTLIEQSEKEAQVRCSVMVTGGAGRWIARIVGPDLGYDPHLVLRGIACAATWSTMGPK